MNKYKNNSDLEIRVLLDNAGVSYSETNMFKLAIKNRIAIKPIMGSQNWEAISEVFELNANGSGGIISVLHINPCRAIAECYLLMRDALV